MVFNIDPLLVPGISASLEGDVDTAASLSVFSSSSVGASRMTGRRSSRLLD